VANRKSLAIEGLTYLYRGPETGRRQSQEGAKTQAGSRTIELLSDAGAIR
jgi:hypothetical protein